MTSKVKVVLAAAAMLASAMAMPAQAYDWNVPTAHVTRLEATYMPNTIAFQIDQAAGSSCPAGTMLNYGAQGADQPTRIANAQAVYSALLTALAAGRSVTLYGNVNCTVTFVHIS